MKTRYFSMYLTCLVAVMLLSCCSPKNARLVNSLDESLWDQSIWISATDANVVTGPVQGNNERAADGSNWFVSKVANDSKVVSAKWMTTGLGVYKLFVNGTEVGNEFLKPGFTHYEKTKISFTYDITDIYKNSKGDQNVLSAQVTPGWWADKIVTPGGHDGMIGKKCAFRSVLQLTYSDGSVRIFGTNLSDWKAGTLGPVRHAAIFDGEEYDASELPGYAVDFDRLSSPEENKEFSGCIVPTNGAEIYLRHDISLSPVKAYTWKGVSGENENQYGKVTIVKEFSSGEEIVINEGETLVVDFGQNCAAVPYFEFKADEGTTLTCLPSELLNDGNGDKKRGMDGPEGSCHRRNLRTPDTGMILKYTFAANDGYSIYHPSCTFFGYRLVSVTATGKVLIKAIKSIPVSSISKDMEIGHITCGNELINRLISNTIWGQRSNYLSVPTDCPQRNERLGWTADTEVFTETGAFFANTLSFFHKWMRDMRDTQSDLGGFPGVAPLAQYGSQGAMMRLGWADAGIIVPWTIWKQFADVSIIEENWEAMEKFINHIDETKYDHQTLSAENGNYQWADWLSYEPLESSGGGAWGENGLKPESYDYWNYLSTSYWIMDAEMMRDMAKASGHDYEKYEKMLSKAKEYAVESFFDENGNFKTSILNTMQTPALFALRNGLVTGEARDSMIFRLRKNFEEHGNCLQTGFLGTSILMKTLTDNGMQDIAYELLFQRKNPSWLYSVDNGATTIWERWNSYTLESGMGPSGMNSFNHYAYGCVCAWIWETACGISADVNSPGFKNIIMKPVPDKRLGYIKGEYKSASGIVKSQWRYEADKWIWEFTIPEGASASVTIPGDSLSVQYESGSYKIEKDNL